MDPLLSSAFKEKTLLITGGSGSFGNAVLRRFLNSEIGEIRILSRDEKKQEDMRKRYANDKIKFFIGDVRDYQSIVGAVRGSDFVFHAAALKQVPSCEFYPLEAVKTNVLGTENVLEAAINHCVARVIVLSTDKAVYPINAMGMSKAIMEKLAIAKSRVSSSTVVNVTRYGNVMCSRGSVIPLFVKQIRSAVPITVTDLNMTRFMMTLDDAVDLVFYAFQNGSPGDIFVQKAPAATVDVLATALKAILGAKDHPVQSIGVRHGEKLFEVLLSREEVAVAQDLGNYYKVAPDLRGLNYTKFFDAGDDRLHSVQEYSSNSTGQLSVDVMSKLLMRTRFIPAIVAGDDLDSED